MTILIMVISMWFFGFFTISFISGYRRGHLSFEERVFWPIFALIMLVAIVVEVPVLLGEYFSRQKQTPPSDKDKASME